MAYTFQKQQEAVSNTQDPLYSFACKHGKKTLSPRKEEQMGTTSRLSDFKEYWHKAKN